MRPAHFLAAYQRTVDNIPALLSLWSSLDGELREHFHSEMVRLLSERASLVSEGAFVGADGDLLAGLDARLRGFAEDLRKTIGDIFPSVPLP